MRCQWPTEVQATRAASGTGRCVPGPGLFGRGRVRVPVLGVVPCLGSQHPASAPWPWGSLLPCAKGWGGGAAHTGGEAGMPEGD